MTELNQRPLDILRSCPRLGRLLLADEKPRTGRLVYRAGPCLFGPARVGLTLEPQSAQPAVSDRFGSGPCFAGQARRDDAGPGCAARLGPVDDPCRLVAGWLRPRCSDRQAALSSPGWVDGPDPLVTLDLFAP